MSNDDFRPVRWTPDGAGLSAAHLRPFYTFLFKIASRCNLDCSYCYVYRGPDQSWREKPRFMSLDVAKQAAQRIAEHVIRHNLREVAIVFHGGEPLLAGEERIRQYVGVLRATIPCQVELAIQTNGTLIDQAMVETLCSFGIRVGISIDGDEKANDLNRRFHNGKSSYKRVLRAVELIRSRPEGERMLGGFLSVVDLRNHAAAVYQAFVDLGARSVDLLLPDAHHDAPPYRPDKYEPDIAYGQWMSEFFDCWYTGNVDMEVRFLEELIALIVGGTSSLEAIGAKSVDLIVVDSDGAIEAVDTLKVVGRHATALGMNVWNDSFDDALRHPAVYSRMMGYQALCATCQQCPDLEFCGGGYLPHRYGRGNDFLNPSVYCADLRYLISHVRQRLRPLLGKSGPGEQAA